MTFEIDYDPALARRLDARLASIVPVARIGTPARRTGGKRVAAAVVAATLAIGALGLGLEINATADSQGLSCLDAFQKVKLYASGIAAQLEGATAADRLAAKMRIKEYADTLIGSSCADETKTDLQKLRSSPIPLPTSGAGK